MYHFSSKYIYPAPYIQSQWQKIDPLGSLVSLCQGGWVCYPIALPNCHEQPLGGGFIPAKFMIIARWVKWVQHVSGGVQDMRGANCPGNGRCTLLSEGPLLRHLQICIGHWNNAPEWDPAKQMQCIAREDNWPSCISGTWIKLKLQVPCMIVYLAIFHWHGPHLRPTRTQIKKKRIQNRPFWKLCGTVKPIWSWQPLILDALAQQNPTPLLTPLITAFQRRWWAEIRYFLKKNPISLLSWDQFWFLLGSKKAPLTLNENTHGKMLFGGWRFSPKMGGFSIDPPVFWDIFNWKCLTPDWSAVGV